MANDSKFNIRLGADITAFQKDMARAQKAQEEFHRKLAKNTKDQIKLEQDYQKDFLKFSKQKEKLLKEQHDLAVKMQRVSQQQTREEARAFDKQSRKEDQQRKKEQRDFKQMMRDFAQSPMGRFLVGPQGRVGRATGGAVRGAARGVMSLGGGLAGMLIGASVAGYQRRSQYGETLAQLSGLGAPGQIRAGLGRAMGGRLGYNIQASAEHARLMGRATGVTGPRELQQAMRATGLEGGEAASIFGAIAQGGSTFRAPGGGIGGVARGQSQGGREFQKMIAAGMESGLERGRLPEFFSGVTSLMKEQQRISTGKVGGADYARTLALWGQTGLAGMRGGRGAEILGKLQSGFQQPGGGESGKAFMLQSMGFGTPGGKTSFYEAEKMREEGATGENIMRMMTTMQQQFGTGQEAALALRETFGVSLQQAEALLDIYNSSESSEDKLKQIDEKMEGSKSLEQQSVDYSKSLVGIAQRNAKRFNKSVEHGRKSAEYLEQIEDWQMKLVDLMFDAVEYLKEIFNYLKIWITGQDPKAVAKYEAAKVAADKAKKITDPAERAKALRKAAFMQQQATKSDVATGGVVADALALAGITDTEEQRIGSAETRRRQGEQTAAGLKGQSRLLEKIKNLPLSDKKKAALAESAQAQFEYAHQQNRIKAARSLREEKEKEFDTRRHTTKGFMLKQARQQFTKPTEQEIESRTRIYDEASQNALAEKIGKAVADNVKKKETRTRSQDSSKFQNGSDTQTSDRTQ